VEVGTLIGKSLYVSLICLLTAMTCHATAHVFVQTSEGVWLASDSLWRHTSADGSKTSWPGCKVVVSRGRLIFNAGQFKDSKLLMMQESTLPFAVDIETTKTSLVSLFADNNPYSPEDRPPSKFSLSGGILQVHNSVFQEQKFGQNVDRGVDTRTIDATFIGIPHGFGIAVEKARNAALKDPEYAARIAKNPKEELLKILGDEVTIHSDEVGPPFTVLLLHNDGTVSDYSDKRICLMPFDAVHVEKAPVTSK
jgi:hypothetical protein